jgi:hypothetical protein
MALKYFFIACVITAGFCAEASAQVVDPVCVQPQLQTTAMQTGKINVKDAGAIGNGSNDDTNRIQIAIDCAFKGGEGYTVYFPPGTYKITSGLNIHRDVDLLGEGIGWASVIRPTSLPSGTAGIYIDGSKQNGGWAFKNTIKGLNIDMQASVGKKAIQINNAYNIHIVDTYIRANVNFINGIPQTSTSSVAVVDINTSNHVTLDHIVIYGERGIGTGLITNDSWVTALNADIEGHETNVIVSESAIGKGKFNMYGGYLERFGLYGIRFNNTSYNRVDGVVIKIPNNSPHGISFNNSTNNLLTGVSLLCATGTNCTALWGSSGNNITTSLIQGNTL